MKKAILIINILIIAISCIFSDNTPTWDYQEFTQKIGGYIADNEVDSSEDYTYLYVEPFIDPLGTSTSTNGYSGINLDYTDDDSTLTYTSSSGTAISYKYMIIPTTERLTDLGLKVSTFTVYVTFTDEQSSGANVIIKHSKLYLKNSDGTLDTSVSVDYELGALYAIDDGNEVGDYQQQICLSYDSTLTSLDVERKIVIALTSDQNKASIQDAGLFFRMTNNSFPTTGGQYTSNVVVTLEAI